MLRIRFSRTGKVGQPSFRIVVAEHRVAVKGRFIEILGHYLPARKNKVSEINKERISYWISKGALPSSSVASLLKKQGMADMDRYLSLPNRMRKKKGESQQKTSESKVAVEVPKTASAVVKADLPESAKVPA